MNHDSKNNRRIWSLGRRDLLRGLSAGATVLVSSAAPGLNARAQQAGSKKFAGLFQANGVIESAWRPSGSGRSYSLSGTVLEPLEPHKDKLIVLDGLDMDCAHEGEGSQHQRGVGCMYTGTGLRSGSFEGCGGSCSGGWANGPSVDQEIAKVVGAGAAFKSVELGVNVESSDNRARIAYSAANAPLPPENSPQRAFDRLFASVSASGTSEEPQIPDTSELERIRLERRSVLDAVTGELQSIRGRIGREHWQKLDVHMSAVRELERRLQLQSTSTTRASSPMCGRPTLSAQGDDYQRKSRDQLDIIAAAFACDVTRVATLMWSRGGSYADFPFLGVNRGWHDIGHDLGDGQEFNTIYRFISGEFAYFLERLESLGVFGDSLVVWANELSNPESHSLDNLKFVLTGSAGGQVDLGKYVQSRRRAHNCLLVSCLQAMGGNHTEFGHPNHQNGRLEEVFK